MITQVHLHADPTNLHNITQYVSETFLKCMNPCGVHLLIKMAKSFWTSVKKNIAQYAILDNVFPWLFYIVMRQPGTFQAQLTKCCHLHTKAIHLADNWGVF